MVAEPNGDAPKAEPPKADPPKPPPPLLGEVALPNGDDGYNR